MNHQDFQPYGPSILLALFVVIIMAIGNNVMNAFGYAKITRILVIAFIPFLSIIIVAIYEHLHDKLSDKQSEEKK